MQKHTRSYLRTVARSLPLLAAALFVGRAQAAAAKVVYTHMQPLSQYLAKSAADEVALARSAAPAAVSGEAQILTLGRHGYEVAAKGTNGFVCLVERSWQLNFDNPKFWDPGVRTPICFNAGATQSVLNPFLERTGWVFAGMSREQMAARTHAVAPLPPVKGSMAYMMSKRQLICAGGTCSHWYPHLMFYFPTAAAPDWGVNQHGGPVFSGHINSLTTVFFVVVAMWSDGTPSLAGGSHKM